MKSAAKTIARKKDFQPTVAQFTAFQACFDYFNDQLFGGNLPKCILNLSRASKALGFFAPDRWAKQNDMKDGAIVEGGQTMHEISLNPDHIWISPLETMDTLVHEMCHLQRQVTGKAPRAGYHDKQWAEMMLAVGLQPMAVGNPDKMTGQRVSDKPIPGGAFLVAFNNMPEDILLPFSHIAIPDRPKKEKTPSKVKYTCPQCEANAWGKPDLSILCGDCDDDNTGRPLKMLTEDEIEAGESYLADDLDRDEDEEGNEEE